MLSRFDYLYCFFTLFKNKKPEAYAPVFNVQTPAGRDLQSRPC